jgi:hypothetical protein
MRAPVPAVLVALVVAAVGAVLLGEHPLVGLRPLLAGVLFGVAVGETVATFARRADRYLLAAAALVAQAGLVWGTWISNGRDLADASPSAWFGVVVGALAAPLWLRSAGPRGAHSPDGPAPAPGD